MNILDKTKNILRENNIKAKKSFGQNFLIDEEILQNITSFSEVKSTDTVIEIGPGIGNLTEYLLKNAREVIAFEIDDIMEQILKKRFKDVNNINIVMKDFLKVNISDYTDKKVKIVANLPYYITTPILFHLLEQKEQIEEITIMVQKEVADRILSKEKSKDYGVLTINIKAVASTKEGFLVRPESFIPSPNVDSKVIKIKPYAANENIYNIQDEEFLKKLVKASFFARRKKLINSITLSGLKNIIDMNNIHLEEIFKKIKLDLNSRAEDLGIESFILLADEIIKYKK